MVPEAPLERTEHGVIPRGAGWFVVNASDAQWFDRGPRGLVCRFEGDSEAEFSQLGVTLFVLGPGETMSMYHWEADQEDFLVLSGEALLLVDEQGASFTWNDLELDPERLRAGADLLGAMATARTGVYR
jgi:hypothetical protein